MTREEAIEVLRRLPIGLMDLSCEQKSDLTEALNIALAVLRGPTREQVGMGMWIRELTPQKLSGRTISHCSKCWHCVFWPNEHTNFCPDCGMPMTDEAVDIVMKRLEALHENNR